MIINFAAIWIFQSCYFLGLDNCASVTCHNSGTCTDLWDSFRCECPSGYLGYLCDLGMDYRWFLGEKGTKHSGIPLC